MSELKPAVSSKDHIQGNQDAPITLVEYGDYQCPHCGRAHPIIKKLQQKLKDKLRFAFRNFPLAEMHPDAMHAALAAEAGGTQHRFWEMHDLIFENQHDLGDAALVKYAAATGLDGSQFQNDFEDPSLLQKIEADFESGIRSGVNGTPSFFVNGRKFDGDWEGKPFLQYLESLL